MIHLRKKVKVYMRFQLILPGFPTQNFHSHHPNMVLFRNVSFVLINRTVASYARKRLPEANLNFNSETIETIMQSDQVRIMKKK